MAHSYKFTGDSPRRLNGAIIKPGDTVESETEIIHGHFDPINATAKAAAKATEAFNAALAERHVKEREAAAQGLTFEEAFPELVEAPVSAGKKSAAPAAQEA